MMNTRFKQRSFDCVTPILLILFFAGSLLSQDLEPRAFSPVPVGLNFVLVGYSYSDGNVFFDKSLPVRDASGELNAVTFAYARTLSFLGASAKLAAAVPFANGRWTGIWLGEPASVHRSGLADPFVSLSVNLIGAPALTRQGMRSYQEGTIVGAAIGVSVPIGKYNSSKLINLGSNRWAFRTRVGISQRLRKLTIEVTSSTWFFTRNANAAGGKTISQKPIVSIQFNAIYQFRRGLWLALGFGYGEGGRTKVSGVEKDTHQINKRFGGTLAYPLNKRHSLKFFYVGNLSTRIGTDFDHIGLFWQIHWGGRD
jgi:hypothetical protein